jgi:anti-sigma factor RsiW
LDATDCGGCIARLTVTDWRFLVLVLVLVPRKISDSIDDRLRTMALCRFCALLAANPAFRKSAKVLSAGQLFSNWSHRFRATADKPQEEKLETRNPKQIQNPKHQTKRHRVWKRPKPQNFSAPNRSLAFGALRSTAEVAEWFSSF